MLGQGRKVLVAITTNEDLRQLHPAVVRPGRCLAHIEIGPLAPAEASAWLGRPVAGPLTLAELYAMRNGQRRTARRRPGPGSTCKGPRPVHATPRSSAQNIPFRAASIC